MRVVEWLGPAGVFVFAGAVAGAAFLLNHRRAMLVLAQELPEVERTLAHVEAHVEQCWEARAYLPSTAEHALEQQLRAAAGDIFSMRYSRASRALGGDWEARFNAARARHNQCLTRMQDYNERFVEDELRHHTHLLVEEENLNREQQVATVRDDARNLVVAAAGSGKTRVLQARVRYLLERRNPVPPHRILALSYTGNAAAELEQRLRDRGVKDVRVSTLHSLGYEILGYHHGSKRKVVDANLLQDQIRGMLDAANKDPTSHFSQLVRDALAVYHRQEREDEEPAERPEYRTLAGETVKSLGERRVADFLFLNGIQYEYEAVANWAPQTPSKKPYQPDFHLTEYDVYIEHWGINRSGEVAPHFSQSSEEYLEKMEWARRVCNEAGKPLVEMYDYERFEPYEEILKERLERLGVKLRPLSLSDLKRRIPRLRAIEESFAKTLSGFVSNARALGVRSSELSARIAPFPPRVQAFGRCGQEVLRRYEGALAARNEIDFTEMIHGAADILESGRAQEQFRFDHILVDEFQDLSSDKARLIKALLSFGGGKLFAVGDDWQAIYAFSGGNVGYIVNFEEHFGAYTLSTLSTNYRSPARVVDAGTALIKQNPRQIKKRVEAKKPTRDEPLVHEVPDHENPVWDRVVQLAQTELERLKKEPSKEGVGAPRVMIITRIKARVHAEIQRRLRQRGITTGDGGQVNLVTAHKSKGTEAEVVIVTDATEDLYGFPCQVEGTELLLPVRLNHEDAVEEERRLFYVALTRATERLHIVTRTGRASRFVAEIEGQRSPLAKQPVTFRDGERVDLTASVACFFEPSLAQADAGLLQIGHLQCGRERLLFKAWRSDSPPRLKAQVLYSFQGLRVRVSDYGTEVVIDRETIVEAVGGPAGTTSQLDGARVLQVRSR